MSDTNTRLRELLGMSFLSFNTNRSLYDASIHPRGGNACRKDERCFCATCAWLYRQTRSRGAGSLFTDLTGNKMIYNDKETICIRFEKSSKKDVGYAYLAGHSDVFMQIIPFQHTQLKRHYILERDHKVKWPTMDASVSMMHRESQKMLFLKGHYVYLTKMKTKERAIACAEICSNPIRARTRHGKKIKHPHLNFWAKMQDYGTPPVEIHPMDEEKTFEEFIELMLDRVYKYTATYLKVYLKVYYEGKKVVKAEIDVEDKDVDSPLVISIKQKLASEGAFKQAFRSVPIMSSPDSPDSAESPTLIDSDATPSEASSGSPDVSSRSAVRWEDMYPNDPVPDGF